ncbi:MAG: trifunctional serine/threonine-protein kinase/ATP-binding protein/sensor histidine kinase [Calditrichia bacterium]
MFDFPGYTFKEQLHEGRNTVVVRATRQSDKAPVILKALQKRNPYPHEAVQLHHEYDVLQTLADVGGVVNAYGVERAQGIHALVLEDGGGDSLRKVIARSQRSLELFYSLAIELVNVIKAVHDAHILHKDINPNNIVYHSVTGRVSLIDFGSASRLSKSQASILNPALIEGTLAYIAPEQTGRMNRSIDYRSDYYALGVTLYELLLGIQPFRSSDPMEQIHSHIAQKPVSPHILNRDIPKMLSDSVLKLIAKHPEDRYQSAEGILADLEFCRQSSGDRHSTGEFVPGKQEVMRRLRIPEKLFGREKEIEALREAFKRTLNGREEFLLISGGAGVGKSVLVNELHKPVLAGNGIFVSGKFDQLQRNVPYFSVSRAFEALIRNWLSQETSILEHWHDKLQEALGNNVSVLIQVIPEMEFLFGKQPDPPELPDAETKNRMREVFGRFIRSIATPEHPLVLFMDDLQWADGASIQLLEMLLTDSFDTFMLVIGTYRPKEAVNNTQLMTSFENLGKQNFDITEINLDPLDKAAVQQMISETVHQEPKKVTELANLIFQKTDGNPYFIGEFIGSLREKELLKFDYSDQRWNWDLTEIGREGITDNVVALVSEKIGRLDPETQKTLTLAACIGTRFQLGMLVHLRKVGLRDTVLHLDEAIKNGMIYPHSTNYTYLYRLAEDADKQAYKLPSEYEELEFSFSHDRVQQAAYGLIPESSTSTMHLKIGRRMLKGEAGIPEDDTLFDALTHINKGLRHVKHIDDRKRIAELNLLAGRRAIASVAYEPSLLFLESASKGLGKENWQHDYDLCRNVELEYAHGLQLNGQMEEAHSVLQRMLDVVTSDIDKARVQELLVRMHMQNGDYDQALEIGLEGLANTGMKFPSTANKLQAGKEILRTRLLLRGKTIEDLINLPDMKNEGAQISLAIQSSLQGIHYGRSAELSGINICKQLLTVLKHGLSAEASNAFSLYGMLLAIGLGNYQDARAFCKLGIKNADKFEDNFQKGRAIFTLASSVNHWTRPVESNLKLIEEVAVLAEESGDLLYRGFCITQSANIMLLQGKPLKETQGKFVNFMSSANRMKFVPAQYFLALSLQTIAALQGETKSPLSLQSETFDEDFYRNEQLDTTLGWVLIWYLQQKLFLGLLFNQLDDKLIAMAEEHRHNVLGQFSEAEYLFIRSLILIRKSPTTRDGDPRLPGRAARKEIAANQRRFRKWQSLVPENFKARYLLVEAERARLSRKEALAMRYYDEAIDAASMYEHLRDEALANELAGLFFHQLGRQRQAALYMQEAVYCYSRWEAWAKVEQLRSDYDQLLSGGDSRHFFTGGKRLNPITDSTETVAIELDIATIMKSAQIFSQEIVLGKLLEKLMRIVMENAGAERGSLIMDNDGRLEIEAYGQIADQEITVLESLPVEKSDILSAAAVNLVARKRQPLVVDDASAHLDYVSDAYVQQNAVKSLLCMPVLNQNKLVALLYLENNLVSGAFTPERLQVLKMLSADIAISIENARLYSKLEDYSHTLEDRVQERTQDLQQRTEELQSALEELKGAQTRLVHAQKMASLGELTAGIAHEIKNPLNFINNFAQLATNLVSELDEVLQQPEKIQEEDVQEEVKDIMQTLQQNTGKIAEHGKRADDIVKGMLMHSRDKTGTVQQFNLNRVLADALNLAQQSHFAQHPDLKIRFRSDYDDSAGDIPGVPQDISRALLNLLTNACHAVRARAEESSDIDYGPLVEVSTKQTSDSIIVRVRDNGEGISKENLGKIFNPFFTTRPAGEGTGLGLSISYDIVVQEHGGLLEVASEKGEFCEFSLALPTDEDSTRPLLANPKSIS